MPTSFIFDSRTITLPGAYSTIKSGVRNPALALAFGNALVIDTSSGANYGGGAGINGTLKNGKDAIYTFDDVRDFRNFVGGGLWWLLSGPLFLPGGGGLSGVSSLTYIRAKTTAPAEIAILFGAQDDSDSDFIGTNNGDITIQVRDEGIRGNGSQTSVSGKDILTKGYGSKVIVGRSDSSKYILQFWRGTFKGLDTAISDGTPYDGIAELNTVPELVVESPEVSTVQELVTWMQDVTKTGYKFDQYFKIKSYHIASVTDTIKPQDVNEYYDLASGGTESASGSDLSAVLDAIADLQFDFILADNWGANARSTNNLTILDWITNTAKIKPDLYIAGGKTVGTWNSTVTSSIPLAQAYNSMFVTVVHGGVKKIAPGGLAFKEYDSIYKAATFLGREAGIAPQIPLTFKAIGIEGELHALNDKEAILGLNKGVLMSRLDNGSFDCVKGVNTLQDNTFLVNPDGTTHSKQLARIIRQLNKEIVVNAKQQLLKKPNGANRNTVSVADVKTWLQGYLNSKVATNADDNLILSFQNIEVTVEQDAYRVTYAFIPNTEISLILFTGTIIDGKV